jgi:4a-hydroxytetrahydrobiopterin dehydratase
MREQAGTASIGAVGIVDRMGRLDEPAARSLLAGIPGWELDGDLIRRTYAFPDFVHAMRFVDAVAAEAERVQHHPDILVRYSKVTLMLSTHDVGGLSRKDFDFAASADRLSSAAR